MVAHQEMPADEKIRLMVLAYLKGLAENADLASVLLFEHRSLEGELRMRHIPQRDRFEGLWRDVLDDGVRTKVFTCSDPALTVRALMGALNWTLTWYHPEGPLSIEQIADHYTHLLLHGLIK